MRSDCALNTSVEKDFVRVTLLAFPYAFLAPFAVKMGLLNTDR